MKSNYNPDAIFAISYFVYLYPALLPERDLSLPSPLYPLGISGFSYLVVLNSAIESSLLVNDVLEDIARFYFLLSLGEAAISLFD